MSSQQLLHQTGWWLSLLWTAIPHGGSPASLCTHGWEDGQQQLGRMELESLSCPLRLSGQQGSLTGETIREGHKLSCAASVLLQIPFLVRKAALGCGMGIWGPQGDPALCRQCLGSMEKLPGESGFSGEAPLLEQNVFPTAAEIGTVESQFLSCCHQ